MKASRKVIGALSILSLVMLGWFAVYVFAQEEDSIKSNGQAGRQEEKDLRDQIRQAEQSGDKEAARSLREQLKAMHQENVQQKQEDQQGLKEARQQKPDANQDGTVDNVERERLKERKRKFDKDNNPPGPKGGEGTNWENKPGPKGGPGASPDRKKFHGQDNQGVRDHGQGIGQGKGQGQYHRNK